MASSESRNQTNEDDEALPDVSEVDWQDTPLPDADEMQWGGTPEAPPPTTPAPVVPPVVSAPDVAPPAPPPPDPGFFRTAGRGLLHGFFKSGSDEAAGALAAAGTDIGPRGGAYRMSDGTTRRIADSGDVYRAVRDTERQIDAGGREHRGITSFVSNAAGDIASDAVLSALGVPVASQGYQIASGALSGLLGSDAELTGSKATANNAAAAGGSALLGGGLGFLAPKVGVAVSKSLPGAMARFRAFLEEQALDKARRVLTNGVDLNVKQPLPDSAVREALDSGTIDVWGTTKSAFQKLEELAEQRGANYGAIVDRLHSAGVQGPRTADVSRELLAASLDSAENSGANKAVARAFEAEADNVRSVAPPNFNLLGEWSGPSNVYGGTPVNLNAPAPPTKFTKHGPGGRFLPKSQWTKLADDVPPPAPPERVFTPYGNPVSGPPQARLELDQAERIKRALQREAKYGRIEDTPINEAKQEIASVYRKNIEDVIAEAGAAAPAGSEVAELASEFLPIKQQLANTLGARDVAMRGAARAAQRGGASGISLFDLANATQAAGTGGLPAMALAGASRIWRERGPSTLANVYDVGSEAAGNFGKWAAAHPDRAQGGATAALGIGARQLAPDINPPTTPSQGPIFNGGESSKALHRAYTQNPAAFGQYAQRLQEAAAKGPEAFATQDWLLAQTDPGYAEQRRRALAGNQ